MHIELFEKAMERELHIGFFEFSAGQFRPNSSVISDLEIFPYYIQAINKIH